jgi:hypothetical protein
MKTSVLNRLRLGELVAAEIPATLDEHRAWIGIYPIKKENQSGYKYRIRTFEVHKQYLYDDNDVWEETMAKKKDYFEDSEENLLSLLGKIVDNLNILDAPWKCDYPI